MDGLITAINEINKFSDFSEKELGKFKKDVYNLGKSNGLDMKEILQISEFSAQLGVGKNELKDFTQNAINLKIGLGLSKDEAVSYSTKISKAFNLNTKDLQVFLHISSHLRLFLNDLLITSLFF